MSTQPRLLRILCCLLLLSIPLPTWAQSVLPDDYDVPEPEPEEPEEEEAEEPPPASDEADEADEDEEPDERDEEPEEEPKKKKKKVARDEDEDRVGARKKSRPRPKFTNRRQSSGLGFTLTVGGLATLRRMDFRGTDHTIKHRPGPYLGGVIHGTQHVLTLDESKSHILIEGEGGFGSAKNADVEPALGRPLTTEHAYLMVLGMFEKPLHPAVDLRLGLGMSALSYTVEPNPDYTGHRYLSLAASFGANYWVSEKIHIGGALVFLPGLDTNQSAGDYGAARSFGGRGELLLNWRFLQPEPPDLFGSANFSARYSYTRFQATLPETQILGDNAGTADTAHALTLMLSYNL